jgi:hypothetical protein
MVIERPLSEHPFRLLYEILSQAAIQKFPLGATGYVYCFRDMSKLMTYYDKFGTLISVIA